MDIESVYICCKAFYNLTTTEICIIDWLVQHGTFVGNAQDFSRALKISYAQVTQALTSLDKKRIIFRNTTGDKKVRMRAVALAPHWEHNLIKDYERNNPETIKNKRVFDSAWAY